jgi:hypothetical protein
MNQSIPTQHPAVVLRSHYLALRNLLAIASIAIVGLTIAVVVLASTTNGRTRISTPSARVSPTAATVDSGARLDRRGIRETARGPLATPTTTASCGDVCSSYRHTSIIASTPTPASAASCGDVCSTYRRAR